MIIPDAGSGYIVFGKYHLVPNNHQWQVKEQDQIVHNFYNKRTALAWCIFDKFKRYQRASIIKVLDQKKQHLLADIGCRKTLGNKSQNYSFYEIVNMKIGPKEANLESITQELEKCISSAKYLQIRGFNNETA
jgi:hypothetical protein